MSVERLKAKFGEAFNPDAVDPSKLVEVLKFLHDECGYEILNNISGVDYLETDTKKAAKAGFEPHLEVVYHLSSFSRPGERLQLKVILPRLQENGALPEVPSVAHVWRTADWHERECYDLVGVMFMNHPDLRRILMNDDWEGHPLRKDYEFPLEYHDIRCR